MYMYIVAGTLVWHFYIVGYHCMRLPDSLESVTQSSNQKAAIVVSKICDGLLFKKHLSRFHAFIMIFVNYLLDYIFPLLKLENLMVPPHNEPNFSKSKFSFFTNVPGDSYK